MVPRSLLLSLLIFLSGFESAHSEDAAAVSSAEVMKIVQIEQLKPLFEYCQAAIPAMGADFNAEFEAYSQKMNLATSQILETVPREQDQGMSREDLANIRGKLSELGRAQVEMVRRQNTAVFCPKFLSKVRATTVDDLRLRLESAFAAYQRRTEAKRTEVQ